MQKVSNVKSIARNETGLILWDLGESPTESRHSDVLYTSCTSKYRIAGTHSIEWERVTEAKARICKGRRELCTPGADGDGLVV